MNNDWRLCDKSPRFEFRFDYSSSCFPNSSTNIRRIAQKVRQANRETFRVNDHIDVSIKYGEDGEPQEIKIKPYTEYEVTYDSGMSHHAPNTLERCNSSLPEVETNKLIDELVPLHKRRMLISDYDLYKKGRVVSIETYEHIRIIRYSTCFGYLDSVIILRQEFDKTKAEDFSKDEFWIFSEP